MNATVFAIGCHVAILADRRDVGEAHAATAFRLRWHDRARKLGTKQEMDMRDFDIIVYGATGFTGRLVAEYLVETYPTGVRWAMAGRSLTKLQEVRDLIGAPADTPLVTADADDPASLRAMCERAAVVITTVGPYQLYGSDLVAACAATGTAYVDLCGEPAWMRHMIDAHHDEAKRDRRADRLLAAASIRSRSISAC